MYRVGSLWMASFLTEKDCRPFLDGKITLANDKAYFTDYIQRHCGTNLKCEIELNGKSKI